MDTTHLTPAHQPRTPLVIPDHVALRALRKFTLDRDSGCHVSTYSTASHGYAQIGWQANPGPRRGTTAHRAAWSAVFGQIPVGMTIDHTCKNRRCVNVSHLRLLGNFENARRTSGRDWPLGECINGHPNSHLVRTDGGRRIRCRICQSQHQRTYRARQRIARVAVSED